MKRIKVLLDFIGLTAAGKIVYYRNVVVSLKANKSVFTNPDEDLEVVNVLIDTFEVSLIATANGGHATTVAMHVAEEAVDEAFRTLAAYVDRIAKGDESRILSAGFSTSKQRASIQKSDLAVVAGANSGTVKLIAKAFKGAGSYVWQYCKDAIPTNESEWIQAGISTQASFEIAGLDIACKYYFRVAVILPTGMTDFTAPVMKVVE